jgi:hypothetical protein
MSFPMVRTLQGAKTPKFYQLEERDKSGPKIPKLWTRFKYGF